MDFDLELREKYLKTQINGTIFVTTRLPVCAEQLSALESGAGELFLKYIPKRCSMETVLKIALEIGEIYMLRFKIDFSSNCRGFAFLQYIDPRDMKRAMEELQLRFTMAKYRILVLESKNQKRLYLVKVKYLSPLQVYQELLKIQHFIKLIVLELQPFNYSYIVIYRNNEDAIVAHQHLRTKVNSLGSEAFVGWLDNLKKSGNNFETNCCLQLSRVETAAQLQQLPYYQTDCHCFKI